MTGHMPSDPPHCAWRLFPDHPADDQGCVGATAEEGAGRCVCPVDHLATSSLLPTQRSGVPPAQAGRGAASALDAWWAPEEGPAPRCGRQPFGREAGRAPQPARRAIALPCFCCQLFRPMYLVGYVYVQHTRVAGSPCMKKKRTSRLTRPTSVQPPHKKILDAPPSVPGTAAPAHATSNTHASLALRPSGQRARQPLSSCTTTGTRGAPPPAIQVTPHGRVCATSRGPNPSPAKSRATPPPHRHGHRGGRGGKATAPARRSAKAVARPLGKEWGVACPPFRHRRRR